MITEQREITGRNDEMVNQIANVSCDMGRLGFEYHDFIYKRSEETGYIVISLIFRK